MPKDLYLQPHAPDPVLPDAAVLELARRHIPESRAVTGVDESGGEARTYAIDDAIILKTQRPHRLRPRTSLDREVFFLRQLAAYPEIRVPRVLGYGRDGGVEYTCMTRMPGVAVLHARLRPAARRAAISSVGTILRDIHQLPQQPFHDSGLFPGDHGSADLKARVAEHFADAAVQLRADGRAWPVRMPLEQLANRALDALPATDEYVALHSNPGPSHSFVDRKTGRFTGLIDFGDAYISHPALDLWRWRLPDDRAAVLHGYTAAGPVGDAFLTTWHVLCILADVVLIAQAPQRSADVTGDLERLLAKL